MSLKSFFLIQVLLYNDNPFVLKIQPFFSAVKHLRCLTISFIFQKRDFHYILPNAVFLNLFFSEKLHTVGSLSAVCRGVIAALIKLLLK